MLYSDVKNIPDLVDTCADNQDRRKFALVLPLITRRALQWADLPRFVYGISSALVEVHRRGMVHRDIKMGNLLWGSSGKVGLSEAGDAEAYVIDFGLACSGGKITQASDDARRPSFSVGHHQAGRSQQCPKDGISGSGIAKLQGLLSREKRRRVTRYGVYHQRQLLNAGGSRHAVWMAVACGTRTYRAPELLLTNFARRVVSGKWGRMLYMLYYDSL